MNIDAVLRYLEARPPDWLCAIFGHQPVRLWASDRYRCACGARTYTEEQLARRR